MSLSKDLAAPPATRPGPQCSIQKLLESLPTTDADD